MAGPNEDCGVPVSDLEDLLERRRKERLRRESTGEQGLPADRFIRLVAKIGVNIVDVCRVGRLAGWNKLQTMYVLPSHQRQGVGTKLWHAAQQHFDPAKGVKVEVAEYNVAAISFYKGLRLYDTGKRFADPAFSLKSGVTIPAVVMTRDPDPDRRGAA